MPKTPSVFISDFGLPLARATFIKRYKRFFADVILPNGDVFTTHCPNTGTMKGLLVANSPALISRSSNPKRKLSHTLEAIQIGKTWVCVNTHRANQIGKQLFENKILPGFRSFSSVQSEVSFGEHTRFDFFLSKPSQPLGTFVEIKAVTLSEEKGVASFPDAITQRGQKHLQELVHCKVKGHGATMLFLCMRGDCQSFTPAAHIDPEYAQELRGAKESGVQILCYSIQVQPEGFYLLPQKLPLTL